MQKYKSTLIDHDVPEEATQEDQKSCGNDDTEVEGINIPLQDTENIIEKEESPQKQDSEEVPESLFTWDFLDEKESPPKVEVKPADITLQKEKAKVKQPEKQDK